MYVIHFYIILTLTQVFICKPASLIKSSSVYRYEIIPRLHNVFQYQKRSISHILKTNGNQRHIICFHTTRHFTPQSTDTFYIKQGFKFFISFITFVTWCLVFSYSLVFKQSVAHSKDIKLRSPDTFLNNNFLNDRREQKIYFGLSITRSLSDYTDTQNT